MDVRNISRLCYGNGFTLWHYKAGVTPLAIIEVPGFFDSACGLFATGDMVLVSGSGGGCVLFVSKADDDGVVVTRMV